MTFWYDRVTGVVEFAISDGKLMAEHELSDIWKHPRASELEKIDIPNPVLDRPATQYRIVDGALQPLPQEQLPESALHQQNPRIHLIKRW